MAIARRSRDDHNWQSWYHFCLRLILTLYRSLEDIGTRSLALLGKGKLTRVLDKAQDSQEIIKLVEELRQVIFVYQVRTRGSGGHSWESLTRGTGVTTTVGI